MSYEQKSAIIIVVILILLLTMIVVPNGMRLYNEKSEAVERCAFRGYPNGQYRDMAIDGHQDEMGFQDYQYTNEPEEIRYLVCWNDIDILLIPSPELP